jgi:2-keto-4-pentenoate hydratase
MLTTAVAHQQRIEMTMDQQVHAQAAQVLLDAYRTGVAVDRLTDTYPGLTIADAYQIQLAQVRRWTEQGAVIKGHKVGLTSAVMQRQLGVDQPDYGHLTGDMFHLEAQPIDVTGFLQPRIEPEIGFVLNRELHGPGVTAAEAAAAIEFVVPALEIIDSRIRDWQITLVDTIADNASSGGVVLGSRFTRPSRVDLRLVGCLLSRQGEVLGTGAGGAVLGSPLNALVWLTNTLGPLGIALHPGQVVLPGSLTAAVPVAAGDVLTAEFAGLGSVTAIFDKKGS